MKLEYLDKIDLFEVNEYSDRVYFVDVNSSVIQTIDKTGDYSRDDLLTLKYLMSSSIHERGAIGSVTLYEVIERVVDTKGNLIVFVQQNVKGVIKS